ncbi:PREDICTED: uncharacterized protein LOC109175142 [Ipomoea nil]|uniref:uncharacterized protein LOC109175142 n=1 Tax=Ipomoea nil TaxID=35883 RepID=UPI000901D5DE|nr:PREDICTED: uncharacterized protein LOC109175142 [Ipomoea nil]
MSTNSSERTVTAATGAPPATTLNPLATAHHFASIKLTTRNFLFWRTQLVPFFRGLELLGYVDSKTPCPPLTIDTVPTSDESASTATTSTPIPNLAYKAWIKQDQSILSLLISSLSDEVMYLAVGRSTSREVWNSITSALGSSTRARCLSLLGKFHSLRQGNSSAAEYIGCAQLLVEDLALAGRPITLGEQNLFVFRGLHPEFRAMAYSFTVAGIPVSIPQISEFLQAQEFIHAEDFPAGPDGGFGAAPSALYAGHGSRNNNGDGGRNGSNGQGRGNLGSGRGGQGREYGGRNGVPRCQIFRAQGHTAVHYYKRYTG